MPDVPCSSFRKCTAFASLFAAGVLFVHASAAPRSAQSLHTSVTSLACEYTPGNVGREPNAVCRVVDTKNTSTAVNAARAATRVRLWLISNDELDEGAEFLLTLSPDGATANAAITKMAFADGSVYHRGATRSQALDPSKGVRDFGTQVGDFIDGEDLPCDAFKRYLAWMSVGSEDLAKAREAFVAAQLEILRTSVIKTCVDSDGE